MASSYSNQSWLQWRARSPLTDNFIGPVKTRFQRQSPTRATAIPACQFPNATTITSYSFQGISVENDTNHTAPLRKRCRRPPTETSDKAKALARRLERSRINQKRYRTRQRAIQQSVNEITKEIRGLELRHRDLSFHEKEHRSPCRVVADMFALLEAYFRSPGYQPKSKAQANNADTREVLEAIQNSFVSDAEAGNVRGVEALMNQLKKHAQYFDTPTLCLEKAEEVTPGVVAATASLKVLVSISTLCFIFPQLLQVSRVVKDTQPLLGKRLLDKPLVCSCSVHFVFDARSGRVARVEASIDWVGALFRVLGNLEDVASVLGGAVVHC